MRVLALAGVGSELLYGVVFLFSGVATSGRRGHALGDPTGLLEP